MRPHFLPRERAVPITIGVSTGLRSAAGRPLPRLLRISLALAGRGGVEDRGLPLCAEARIRVTNERQALNECGAALVGSGHMDGAIHIAGQRPFPFRGRLLLFNGRLAGGRHVVFADMVSKAPPVSFVLRFLFRKRSSGGTEMSAAMPRVSGGYVGVSHMDLTLGRRFGPPRDRRGYLNANCPVPPGFTAFVVPVVEATYEFAGGRRVAVTASRGCSVRR